MIDSHHKAHAKVNMSKLKRIGTATMLKRVLEEFSKIEINSNVSTRIEVTINGIVA